MGDTELIETTIPLTIGKFSLMSTADHRNSNKTSSSIAKLIKFALDYFVLILLNRCTRIKRKM
jgi:hypothetical protein